MPEDETKNNCYLCSLNGRPLAECCIKFPGTDVYTSGHSRPNRGVKCDWFDAKFPTNPERGEKELQAKRVREQAMQKLRRWKKSKVKTSSSAAGETS